jgi:DnaA-homolog protein
MKQIALDIGLHTGPTLTNFFAGPNAAALQHLNLWSNSSTRSPVPTYLWGESSSGKSHLLKASAHALRELGVHVGWLDASIYNPPMFDDSWAAVLMDDVHLYTAQQQHAAFNWFVNAMTPSTGQQRWVLAAGETPPADLKLREDLRTRLGWGHVFALQVLSEPERRAVLRKEADARGVFLSDEVMDFMLNRFSRDLGSLMELLDAIDGYALQSKKSITVPLIKAMMESS